MFAYFRQVAENFRFADLLDISVVSIFLYFILSWLRRRASRSVVVAIGSVVLLYASARMFNMYLTSQVFQAGLTAAIVALVIIFQDDIRTAIERLSVLGTFRSRHLLLASNNTVDALVETVSNLARDKIGALIVIKGREALDRHLSGGISLNGRISNPLLYSIFHPETPSHDGAVIIEGDRIDKFGVRLPLSHNLIEVGDSGTRHTAALGLAERSDALIVVVSEERGTIKIAEKGHFTLVSRDKLRIHLDNYYNHIFPPPAKSTRISFFTRNAGVKIVSFAVAITLWLLFAFRIETVNRTITLPVEYRNVPANWVIENPHPAEIKVSLSGLERAFNFDHSILVASIDMGKPREGLQSIPITEKDLNTPSGVTINEIIPDKFTFRAIQTEQADLPVKIRTRGRLSRNLEISEMKPAPSLIHLTIPHSRKDLIKEVPTEIVDLSQIQESTVLRLRVNPPEGTQLVDENQLWVKVPVTIAKKKSSSNKLYICSLFYST